MSGLRPVQLFNLAIPCNGEPTPALANIGFPATFRITMAAIDPTESTDSDGQLNGAPKLIGSTLRMIRVADDSDDEESDDDEIDFEDMDMANLLDDEDSDENSESDNGDPGPSDPSKSPKARRAAALKELLSGTTDDMDLDTPLTAKDKGKGRIIDVGTDSEGEDDGDLDSAAGAEEFVLCTLDLSKSYQQTLDFTVNEHELVYFSAVGTHDIYLTGNVLIPEDSHDDNDGMFDSSDDENEEDFDLEPSEDELADEYDEEDESDELDNVRITEVDSEDDVAAPQLVKAATEVKKGKNKRAHEDSEVETPEKASIDAAIKNILKPVDTTAIDVDESKLSKSQLKKLRKKMKNNAGDAVEPITKTEEDKVVKQEKEITPNKKVQFAASLVQGPSGSAQTNGVKADKTETKAAKATNSTAKVNGASNSGARVVQGVTIDDRKSGSGPAAKKGDKVSMRYIGKLEKDGKVFDANKKGPPFAFKLGTGEVIKGWDIGLQGISVGGERRITIPAHLAYGSKGMPGIPANSSLVFDVKCLEIK